MSSDRPDSTWQPTEDPPPTLTQTATLVVWLVCVVVGVAGLRVHYPGAWLTEKAPSTARTIRVELVDEPLPAAAELNGAPPPPLADVSAPPPEVASTPQVPPLPAVALPTPEIFAHVVDGPARIVEAKEAAPARAPVPAPSPQPTAPAASGISTAVRHLQYGSGAGAQPRPQYPDEARRANQQGLVVIQFSVGADGSVTSAKIQSPCRWPMLNQAALRAVRDSWRFKPGDEGLYDIPIQFKLNEQ